MEKTGSRFEERPWDEEAVDEVVEDDEEEMDVAEDEAVADNKPLNWGGLGSSASPSWRPLKDGCCW